MLSGASPYQQDTSQETIASILRDEPDLSQVPAQAHRLLKRCLEKDPQKRLRHIGDVMALLDEPPSGPHAAPAPTSASGASQEVVPKGRRWLWPLAGGAAVVAAGLALTVWAP
jgi:serine/threonine protein kinase